MTFIEHRLAGDPINGWAPNNACVLAMARGAGFDIEAQLTDETLLCSTIRSPDPRVQPELDAILRRSER